ncbi:MAG: M23 family metallopeptidase [Oligoflexia bacterium]|nr:M23 family metallopeptidase [Oligoflexia bacterium]
MSKLRFFLSLLLLLLLSLLFLFASCSRGVMRSGRYIQLQALDSIANLSKEFDVSTDAIVRANKNAKWEIGEWVFIPQKGGILPLIYGGEDDLPGSFFDGPMLWPVPSSYRITSLYNEGRGTHSHDGIDVASPPGNYVVAAEEGTISFSGNDPDGYGDYLIIKHNSGVSTLYGHLLKKTVNFGQRVSRGEVIALVGNTGRSTGPHLHFEVRKDGRALDPLSYLKK